MLTKGTLFVYLQVTNVINVQPSVLDGINIVIPQFLNIFHTMHDRCMASLQVIFVFSQFLLFLVFTHRIDKRSYLFVAIFDSIV